MPEFKFNVPVTIAAVDQEGAVRQMEELVLLPKTWHRPLQVEGASILTAAGLVEPLAFRVNLLEGQKTGFFLDHSANLDLAERLLLAKVRHQQPKRMRILDLFCYAGQWSARRGPAA